jgi:hypothetical protein
MGGLGSGRRRKLDLRRTVDDYPFIDVLELRYQSLVSPQAPDVNAFTFSYVLTGVTHDGEIRWRVKGRASSDCIVLTNASSAQTHDELAVEQHIDLVWTSCRFGGNRPWLVCPGRGSGTERCGRSVIRLYKASALFACRTCHHLAYASQWQDADSRILARASRLRVRLGGAPRIFDPFPPKPERMRWTTYDRLQRSTREADEAFQRKFRVMMEGLPRWRQRIAKLAARIRRGNGGIRVTYIPR